MKDKNLMNSVGNATGNAEKVTLSNGEQLSEKINKNKLSQASQVAANASKRRDEEDNPEELDSNGQNKPKEKTKSKVEQAAGDVTSEVLIKTLKASFPYIPEFIIRKLVNSKIGQAMMEKELNKVKMKITLAIVGVVSSALFSLFMVCAIVTLIMSPLAWIKDAVAAVGDFFLSFGNFVIGNGWCSSEEECQGDLRGFYYRSLTAASNDYKEQCGIELNQELITATIFYDRMVTKDSSDMSSGEQFDSENIDEDTYYKYNNYDANEISDLVLVYKNRSSAATCSLSKIEKVMTDLTNIFEGEYEAKDIDDFFNKYQPKILGMANVADVAKELSDLVGGKTDLWAEFITAAREVGSCFDYVVSGIIDTFVSEEERNEQQCTFNEDNYKAYLISYYIPQHYAYLTGPKYNMSYEEIADEILKLGKQNVGGNYTEGSTGTIIIGAGNAGAIPEEILSNVVSPLGSQQMSHTSCFGFYSANNCTPHTGIDISSRIASPNLYSIADGEVVTVISSAVHCQPDWKDGKACSVCANQTGNKVTIKHSIEVNGTIYEFYSEYLHMASVSVRLGQKVIKGQQIGIMGNTGCSTGKHLHFNMLDASKKRYNPEELLQYLNLPMMSNCDEARRVCSR